METWRVLDGFAHRAPAYDARITACLRLRFLGAPLADETTPRCPSCLAYRSARERRADRRVEAEARANRTDTAQRARDEAYAQETARREREREARVARELEADRARRIESRAQRAREREACRAERVEDSQIQKAVRRMERAVEYVFRRRQTGAVAC